MTQTALLDGVLEFARRLAAALLVWPVLAAAGPQYQAREIQDPQGRTLYAGAINADGLVAGRTNAKRFVGSAQAFVASRHGYEQEAILASRYSFAAGINVAGDVVGNHGAKPGFVQAFIRRHDESAIDLFDVDHTFSSGANAINHAGVVVGNVQPAGTDQPQAFAWHDGQVTLLGGLGGAYGNAHAINDAGTIVGTASIAGGLLRAFRYENGQMTMLSSITAQDPGDVAYAISSIGVAAGSCAVRNSRRHACVWQGDEVIDLGTLSGGSSEAFGINGAGVLVGRADNGTGGKAAFVYRGGQMRDLNAITELPTGVYLDVAIAINDQGQILAHGKGPNMRHSFVLEPIR
ncbi:hypothetical protein [Ideonella sp.]|uniref:hypothetical protein n=1 Tax=Ideonella sp. TaxID=1929293 RepID=UPI002B45AE70|nr:hypothetical protein [Ideonella sp.]HJV70248.1 hypothetical protein [Ideonella sp.]